jgi:hypothetical protein
MGLLPQLAVALQRGIIMGTQLRFQSCFQRGAFVRCASGNHLRPDMTLLSSLLQVPFDRGKRDVQQLDNLFSCFPLVNCT